jgi:hypothetical protein
MENNKSYITFGAQMGDVNADRAVGPHLVELSVLLKRYCQYSYCDGIDELAPVLRVYGKIWHFGLEGCEKMRLSKKHRYITVDIGMPQSKWENKKPSSIKSFLINQLIIALELMIKRLKKETYIVHETELWADIRKVKEQFLFN